MTDILKCDNCNSVFDVGFAKNNLETETKYYHVCNDGKGNSMYIAEVVCPICKYRFSKSLWRKTF